MGTDVSVLSGIPTKPSEPLRPAWRELLHRGWATLDPLTDGQLAEAAHAPWQYVENALGVRPARIDVMSVRPVPGATTYTSTDIEAKFHTDITYAIVPPHLQLFICSRPARTGGETVLLDGWQVLDDLRDREPALYDDAFLDITEKPFAVRWFGATVGLRHDNLVFAHSPFAAESKLDEAVAEAVERLGRDSAYRMLLAAGQVLVFNNQRLLHGRSAFADPDRMLVKLHIWLCEPLPAPAALWRPADEARTRLRADRGARNGLPPQLLGIDATPSAEALLRAGIVQETLSARQDDMAATARRLGLPPERVHQWCAEAMAMLSRLP